MYFVYIVICSDNSLYTGITNSIERRVREHNDGKYGAKSLRGKRPVKLVFSEKQKTRSLALKREIEIKGWKREKKIDLIEGQH